MKGACQRRYRSDARQGEAARLPTARILAARLLPACLIALATSACSLSYSLVTLDVDDPETTASIAPKAVSPLSPDLNEEDWRRAKAAMGVALDPQGAGTPVSWDNPETARKGAFTPSGAPFVKDDEICRSFLAQLGSASAGGKAAVHGTACRPSGGEWAITEITPDDRKTGDRKSSDGKLGKPAGKA